MLAVVIPARNESGRIGRVIQRMLRLPADLIIPVLNGCTDGTQTEVEAQRERRVQPVVMDEPLGLDVPRVIGARAALECGAQVVLFFDGDMAGELELPLRLLVQAVRSGRLDLALSRVRRPAPREPRSMASRVTALRLELNEVLQQPALGDAVACHGPHAVSGRLLQELPLHELALPPVEQAMAVRAGLRVGVGASLGHAELNHRPRPAEHRQQVGETIVGDLLEAIRWAKGRPRSRWLDGRLWLGYHPERRLDLAGRQGG